MSGEHSGDQLVQEIRGLVEQELQRLGRKVTLRVEGQQLISGKGRDEARADVSGSVAQWYELPEDLQQKRVYQIAQLLLQASGRAPVSKPPKRQRQRRSNQPGPLSFVIPLFILLVVGSSLIVAYRYLSPNGAAQFGFLRERLLGLPGASAVASSLARPPDWEGQRAVISSTACGEARTRVSRGAIVGKSDVEGWQVELVLLRRGPATDLSAAPALSRFLKRKPNSSAATWIWRDAPNLAEVDRPEALVEIHALPALGEKKLSGVSLVFSGPYVEPYFGDDTRGDYFKAADALAAALGATDGGLFARCANVEAHHIGSWFIGPTPGAAMASLVYFMAFYSDAPILKAEVLGDPTDPLRHGHAFDTINRAAAVLDRSSASMLLGNELGMISGGAGKPARITFAFRDANRATRASVEAAGALRLARAR